MNNSDWKSKLLYFPLKREEKKPAFEGWQQQATSDPAECARWRAEGFDLAILCGSGSDICVVDADTEAAIAELCRIVGRPFPENTFTVATSQNADGTQRRQFYFKHPIIQLKNRTKILGGIDIRTTGGLVVAAGATSIKDHPYKVLNDVEPAVFDHDFLCAIEKLQSLGRSRPKPEPAVEVSAKKLEPTSRHDYLNDYAYRLLKLGLPLEEVDAAVRVRNETRLAKPHGVEELKRLFTDLKKDLANGKIDSPKATVEIDPDGWRDGCKTFAQLSPIPRQFALSQLIPMKAMTALCGPSFNGKTFVALAWALAISTGKPWLRFFPRTLGVPVGCIYHVPEMDEAMVRDYMVLLGFEESEHFLVRPMECSLWSLSDPRMLRSSEGRVVFLDTQGYFNPAEDSSSYKQSLEFALLVHNLLQNGALAVVGLFHPPKYASQESLVWTLENTILGSAGYGGLLRSCIRVKNLNPDLNDPNVWMYCQGMKNPGLKPFQLSGPVPLKMKLYPSPFLSALQASNDPRAEAIFKGFEAGKSTRELQTEHHISPNKLSALRKQWEERQAAAAEVVANTAIQADLAPEDFVTEEEQ